MEWTQRLLDIMAKLRDPQEGCPWDLEQDFRSIAPSAIEEAYEVVDAIEREEWQDLKEELGDLLLQVVFHAQMAKERGLFDFQEVAKAISEKLIVRHPHIFGDESAITTAEDQLVSWEAIKKKHRDAKTQANGREVSILDDVPLTFPALTRARKLQKRAASVGFDWSEVTQVVEKLEEELLELKEEIALGESHERLMEEMGDVLFSACNVARHLKIDGEEALRGANAKFVRRFHYIEEALRRQNRTPQEATLEELDALWDEARAQSQKASGS